MYKTSFWKPSSLESWQIPDSCDCPKLSTSDAALYALLFRWRSPHAYAKACGRCLSGASSSSAVPRPEQRPGLPCAADRPGEFHQPDERKVLKLQAGCTRMLDPQLLLSLGQVERQCRLWALRRHLTSGSVVHLVNHPLHQNPDSTKPEPTHLPKRASPSRWPAPLPPAAHPAQERCP